MRIGIDLGGTKIEIAALAEDGGEMLRRRIDAPEGNYTATLDAVAALIVDAERELGAASRVGIGIPGTISAATGLVKNANSTWLIGQPLDRDLEGRIKRPVRCANDANCFTLSEAIDGAGAGAHVVFGVILGTGVGAGIVIDGVLLQGANGIAGEWGHNPLPWPGGNAPPAQPCYCGRAGCIETYLSGAGLARIHETHAPGGKSAEDIAAMAGGGDDAAMRSLEQYASLLARSLAHVINILDPDVIVLGGGLSNIGQLYTLVPKMWGQWVFSDRVDTKLVANLHGDSSGVRGAAWLWGEPGQAP
jgi:fructokinase